MVLESSIQPTLNFNVFHCVHTDYLYAECQKCLDACPYEVFSLIKNKIVAHHEKCLGCGGCIGGCPSQALSLSFFDPDAYILEMTTKENTRLSCREDTPCLAVFDTPQLLTAALRKEEALVCDLSACASCEHNQEGVLSRMIEQRIEQANTLLTLREGQLPITIEKDLELPERRGFFKKALGLVKESTKAVVAPREVDGTKSAITAPFKAIALRNSLKESLETFPTTQWENDHSFTAGKVIDVARCTNCGDCSTFCPTQAISRSHNQEEIFFQLGQCIACGICIQKCPEQCITNTPSIDLVDFAFNRMKVLASFQMAVCLECRTGFVYKGGEQVCPRCLTYRDDFAHMFKTADEL